MPSLRSQILRQIDARLGRGQRNDAFEGRSVYAWSRVGEKDGEEGSEREESDMPVIVAGLLTIVVIGVLGRWLWIRNGRR
jgi:hypothetical protein